MTVFVMEAMGPMLRQPHADEICATAKAHNADRLARLSSLSKRPYTDVRRACVTFSRLSVREEWRTAERERDCYALNESTAVQGWPHDLLAFSDMATAVRAGWCGLILEAKGQNLRADDSILRSKS